MPTFTTGLAKYAADGCLVKPLLIQYFQDPANQPSFEVFFEPPRPRPPDGWFHASTHPLLNEADLVTYMRAPEKARREEFGATAKIAVYFGTLMHEVTGHALDQYGVTVPLPPGPCMACGRPRPKPGRRRRPGECGEHGAADLSTRSRGHLDKILDFKMRGTHGYDFKTIYGWGLSKVPDMDLEFFKQKWPNYWAQAQEYMRLTGLRRYIVLFMSLGSPWEFREFQFEFDPAHCAAVEAKYRRVLAAMGVAA
jgi:hypothetical protein